ncbi:MAG: glycosyl hydrolase [Opitutaceae bacterium]|jgi:mannan endo-1,4-beta-mannosidase
MKSRPILPLALALCLLAPTSQLANPANPNATPEAQKLLAFLVEIGGHYTIAAQHNFASSGSKYTDLTKAITGKAPLLWGSDFSFAYVGAEPQKFQHCGPLNLTPLPDPLYYVEATPEVVRQRIVDSAIRLHKEGYLITLMWHAAPPGADDYCDGNQIWTWERRPNQQQWDELTTDGTPMNLAWQKQVDRIAGYLGQLRDAKVPVLWRPYHEMNGKWFWWCDKKGADGFKKLWIMMYDRFVNLHKLDNLIWVWDTNAPRATPGDEAGAYEDFYPGAQYVDVLAADVYHKDWKQSHHDDLLRLAAGKPIALGEVGEPPSSELLDHQPQWTWFMPWFLQARDPDALRRIFADKRVLTKDDVTIDAEGNIRIKAAKAN